jgi:hypothetical protein
MAGPLRVLPFFYEEIDMDGLLLAALPSGGSDWVAQCLLEADDSLVYFREYFCPYVNWQDAEQLENVVGDTMFCNTKRMGQNTTTEKVNQLLDGTWRKTGYTFTKENYIAFQLEQFAQFFTTVVLVRSFNDTFPPSRRRVIGWYEHFYAAMLVNDRLTKEVIRMGTTPTNRAAIGHWCFTQQLKWTAKRLSLPLLDFSVLARASDVELFDHTQGVAVDRQRFVDAVMRTRSPKMRFPEHDAQWRDAVKVYLELEKNHERKDWR